jgi:ABC-type uncharacterized transport system permease subunit
MAGIEWCAALLWFLSVFGLRYFQQSYPISTYESRDWVMLLLCDSFLVFGLKSIFQQSYPISTWKQGLSDVLLLVIPLLRLKSFQQSYPISTYKARIRWCAAFVIPFFMFGLKSIFNSPTIPTYESRDWVMCCSLWFLSLCLVLEYFSKQSTWFHLLKGIFQQSYPISMKAGLSDVLLFCDSFLCVWS